MRASALLALILLTAGSQARADLARDLLAASGAAGGLAVYLGCDDVDTIVGLRGGERFVVQAIARDAEDLARARSAIRERGCHGPVSAVVAAGELPYIDSLVNLVVIPQFPALPVSGEELRRVLAPGGVAMLGPGVSMADMGSVAGDAEAVPQLPGWTRYAKPVPAELDEWGHWLHGPDNNAVSSDRQVGVSRSLQWTMPPSWGRHHNLVPSMSAMVSAGGRVYCIIDEAPIAAKGAPERWALLCRDAYNGLLLWRKPVPEWGWREWSDVEFGGVMRFKRPDQLFRRLVAAGDTLFATLGFHAPVVAIDGATGQVKRTFEGTENTASILHRDGVLYLSRNPGRNVAGQDVLAVDARTGRMLWEKKGYSGVTAHGDELKAFADSYLTLGEKQAFFIDRGELVALDLATGEEAWRTPRPTFERSVFGQNRFEFANFCTLVHHDGLVLLGQLHPSATNLNRWQQKDMELAAYDAATGRRRWQHTGMSLAHFTPPDVLVAQDLVWTLRKNTVSLVGLNLTDGTAVREFPVKNILVGHHHRCYRNRATEQLYLFGEEGIEYVDFGSGAVDIHHWMRGACAYGIMPANGLIYLPTHACGCHRNVKLHGFLALANRPEHDRGPAKRVWRSEVLAPAGLSAAAESGGWPVYKHDNRRSNCAGAAVPKALAALWQTALPARLTPPIVVGDSVFLASPDAHLIHCIDARTGSVRWQQVTEGRVDTPPTYWQGRLLFGSRNGVVACMDSRTGAHLWRVRAGGRARLLTADGQLESVWPLHGSVLVREGRGYCIAGRSMHLDGGLTVIVLDAVTGEILQQHRLQADREVKGELAGAVLPDLLVADDGEVTMRGFRVDAVGGRSHGGGRARQTLRPSDGGLLDRSWFNSSFWKHGAVSAQMLAFDGDMTYGILAQSKLIAKSYGQDIFTLGQGYRVFAASAVQNRAGPGSKGGKKKRTPTPKLWQTTVPIRPESIVLTSHAVMLAGPPDTVGEDDDPWAVFEGRRHGLLLRLSRADGRVETALQLPSPPVFDGLAAAGNRLYASLRDGTLVCIGAR